MNLQSAFVYGMERLFLYGAEFSLPERHNGLALRETSLSARQALEAGIINRITEKEVME